MLPISRGLLVLALALLSTRAAWSQAIQGAIDAPKDTDIGMTKNPQGQDVILESQWSGFGAHFSDSYQGKTITVEARWVRAVDGSTRNELIYSRNFAAQFKIPERDAQGCSLHNTMGWRADGTVNFLAELKSRGAPSGKYRWRILAQNDAYEYVVYQSPEQEFWSSSGDVRVIVRDGDQVGKPTMNDVRVEIAEPVGNTYAAVLTLGAEGALLKGLVVGTNTVARVQKSGFMEGRLAVRAVEGKVDAQAITYRVSMYANKPPTLDNASGTGEVPEGTGGDGAFPLSVEWWENLFRTLFIPTDTTLEKWRVLINKMKSWGPLGLMAVWSNLWSSGSVNLQRPLDAGPELSPLWSVGTVPWGGGVQTSEQFIDLRPFRSADVPGYADGGRGTFAGSVLGYARPLLGWGVYALAIIGAWRIVMPRFNIG